MSKRCLENWIDFTFNIYLTYLPIVGVNVARSKNRLLKEISYEENSKKSASKTTSAKTAVLRVASPITVEETPLENLPARPRDNRLPASGSIITKTYRGKPLK